MLDGLLGRSGFSSKCKSLIKPTRTRIDVLRRRAEAKQRFLKEDLAKLLANGLDVNAYGRTEDFIAGLNMLSCYNFIDQSCEYILKQLSVMQKLGQCPEECRETVASLMFAAARFSDLPELRDLRDVFQDRYGNGLECYVNQVFIEKLASKPPVVEKKIKLLQDISAEFSIQWDSKGFKQRMDSPSTLAQDQARKLGPSSVNDDKYKVANENNIFRKNDQRYKERTEPIYDRPTLPIGENVNVRRKEVLDIPFVQREEKHAQLQDQTRKVGPSIGTDDKYKSPKENNIFHKNHHPSKQSVDHTNEGPPFHNSAGNSNFRRKEVLDIPFVVGREEKRSHKAEVYLSKPRPESDSNNGIRKLQLKEDDVKSIEEKQPVTLLKPCYNTPLPPPPYTKPNTHHHHHQSPSSGDLPPPNSGRRKKDQKDQNDIPLPKPRSVRKKHSKSSSSHDDVGSSEDSRIVKRISSSRRKERKGLQILFDDEHYHYKDDEEKMMDKLLLHYSKKPSAYDGKLRKKNSSKSPVKLETETETNVPVRSISLPHESEPKKVYARANSFQPDNQAPHVHPKLPDYDDLAARFAALRGR